jgi:hypothetical protein
MRRVAIPYAAAIQWMADNDDTYWLDTREGAEPIASVTACMVADIYGRDTSEVTSDLRRVVMAERARRKQAQGVRS